MTLLSVTNLSVRYKSLPRPVVDGLSFSINKGESIGLVGESGSGKTQTALAILGLLPDNARSSGSRITSGRVGPWKRLDAGSNARRKHPLPNPRPVGALASIASRDAQPTVGLSRVSRAPQPRWGRKAPRR